jgi:hypothetical protein
MPKQFYKLNDFSGGLNLIRDARDIAPNELTQADNISLSVAGSVRTANRLEDTDGDFTMVSEPVFPGGGVFYFETDKVGTSAAKDTGEEWTAAINSLTGQLSLKGSVTGTRSDVADMGTIASVTFGANELEFSGTTLQRRTGSYDFRVQFAVNDAIRISGCTDQAANNRITRINYIYNSGEGLSLPFNFTNESSEAGTVIIEKLANGVFFAADDTLRVGDGVLNSGLKRKQYGYVKQIHFEDAGAAKDTYDDWYANDCDLSPPTELHTTSSSYPTAGTGFFLNTTTPATDSNTIGQFAAKKYQIAGTFIYMGGQESKLYIPTSNNTFTTVSGDYVDIDVNASPAYDERITGARIYMRPDGTSEPWSLLVDISLRDGCRTGMDDEYKQWAVGGGATEAGVDTLILTSENLETYTILNGFGPDEFSITLSEYGEGYKDAIIANRRVFACNMQMVDEDASAFTDATCDYNNDPTITMDSTAALKIGMSVSGTGIPTGAYIASVTNATAFELSASTTGGSVTNGTLTFGNIMKKMRDRIMYTPPNKYETFPRSFFIDVVRGDSDEYTALATYGDRLFAFKRRTLYIINIGSPSPTNWFLESTEKNSGVRSPAGVFQNQNGIYWANNFGAFFFDGSSIRNLIDEKIPQKDWFATQYGIHQNVFYHGLTNSLYVVFGDFSTDATYGLSMDVYVYSFDSRAWSKQDFNSGYAYDYIVSGYIPDGTGGIVFNDMPANTSDSTVRNRGVSEGENGRVVDDGKWVLKTKDIDFGDPGHIKKVYGVRITYQSSAAQTTPISYAIDGIGNFASAGGGAFTGNFADTNDVWDVLYAYPSSPVECQSMQLQVSNPTTSGTININDISIEYRPIHKRVT